VTSALGAGPVVGAGLPEQTPKKGRRFEDARFKPLKELDSRKEKVWISLPPIWIFHPSDFASASFGLGNPCSRPPPPGLPQINDLT
jgi:hypothetical protein